MDPQLLQGFQLGELMIEPLRGQVTDGTASRHMPPKAVEVLLCLAQHPGEIVERARILEAVWGSGQGSEEALSHTVSTLRQALDDHADAPVYIQTLPRRGYRLLKAPSAIDLSSAPHPQAEMQLQAQSQRLSEAGWLENLRERGVIQAAITYAVFGWLLIQVADIVFDQLQIPQLGTFVTVLVIAGFPIVVLLSWFLEFRDGRAVLHELSPAAARRRRYSRTYLSVTAALGIAAVGVFFYDRNIGLPQGTTIPDFEAALPPVQDNSFAVLPFKNVDGSEQTGIFANGLVDDVITSLSQVSGLRVSARGDSFMLSPDTPSQRVRERLRVSRYLEGSVETAGEVIRVIVQLIDSQNGFHVFSRSFDRTSDDYFSLRDEITNLTVSTVRVSLPDDAQTTIATDTHEPGLDAYLLYRRGVDAARQPLTMQTVNQAIDWYDAALEADPEYAAAHAGKCSVYVDAWSEVDKPAMIDRARASCALALNLNANLAVVHTAMGRLYESTGRLSEAEDAFRQALRGDSSSTEALRGLGEVLRRQNRLAEAEDVLRSDLELHPGSENAHFALGTFMFHSGRYAEASEQFAYTVALNPDNMNGYSNLGTAQMLGGFFPEAVATLNRALEIEPRQVTYSNLGLLYYYLGDLDAAIAAHDRAVALEPGDYLARVNRGDALWAAGRQGEARATYRIARDLAEQALQVDAQDPFLRIDLAWIDAMLGDLPAARGRMERAIPLAPDDPYTHYIDGLVHLRGDELDAAARSFSRAVDLGYSRALLQADPHLRARIADPRFAAIVGDG